MFYNLLVSAHDKRIYVKHDFPTEAMSSDPRAEKM